MGKSLEGCLDGGRWRFAIVVSRYNSFVTTKLLDGAIDALKREVPLVASRMGKTGRYDAVLCLGAIIRGDTPHFDYVANESARNIADLSLRLDLPVIYGIVTAENLEQAIERAGTRMGNKGAEAAFAGLEMVNLLSAVEAED